MEGQISSLEQRLSSIAGHFRSKDIDENQEINKILHDYYVIRQSIVQEPRLKEETLKRIYNETLSENKAMYDTAKLIDCIDRLLAPVQCCAGYLGASTLFYGSKIAELAVKLTFSAYYLSKTNDFKSLISFAASEIFGISLRYGSIVNMYDLYRNSVKCHLREASARRYIDTIFNMGSQATDQPKELRPEYNFFQKNKKSFTY
jgi:hypothetical protein